MYSITLAGFNFAMNRIGADDQGIDGSDEYILLTCHDEDIDDEQLRAIETAAIQHYYRDTHRPGGYFCHSVTIIRMPYLSNKLMMIIHHQYDV